MSRDRYPPGRVFRVPVTLITGQTVAGWPVRRAGGRALLARAQHVLGIEATALDYACHWLRCGYPLRTLAGVVASDINRPFHHTTLSNLLRHSAPDAKARIAETRQAARASARAIICVAARDQALRETPLVLTEPASLSIHDLQTVPTAREAYASL
jgi:hypothetical protein